MGSDHRKLLGLHSVKRFCMEHCKVDKDAGCPPPPCRNCTPGCQHMNPPVPPRPRPPPPVHLGDVDLKQKHFVIASMSVVASMIAMFLLFAIFCIAIRVYYLRRNSSGRRDHPPILFGTQDDFLDENQGPTFDHPIWYIQTIGLPQSVIESITVFRYKKDEGLIEGTECSVCLSEFQEEESLRLLPKCSHAFHIPCIDTWLRSHKNCPLCRAPVFCGTNIAPQASQSEPSLNDLDSRNENAVENHRGEETGNMGEGGTSEVRNVPIEDVYTAENSKKGIPLVKTRNCASDSLVLSDIAAKRRVVEEEMQPMRRSVSLDFSAAMTIYEEVAVVVNNGKQHQGSFDDTQSISKPNSSKSKMVAKPTSVSSSISKMMKSSSIGSSLQKGPISMKRSFSFSGKRSSSKHSRRHSVLPL